MLYFHIVKIGLKISLVADNHGVGFELIGLRSSKKRVLEIGAPQLCWRMPSP